MMKSEKCCALLDDNQQDIFIYKYREYIYVETSTKCVLNMQLFYLKGLIDVVKKHLDAIEASAVETRYESYPTDNDITEYIQHIGTKVLHTTHGAFLFPIFHRNECCCAFTSLQLIYKNDLDSLDSTNTLYLTLKCNSDVEGDISGIRLFINTLEEFL